MPADPSDHLPLRIAFVSAPGASAFMEEILVGVASAVAEVAADRHVEAVTHRGYLSDVVDHRTVAVVVPHEYFAVSPTEKAAVYARTIAFGVEHPGTNTFETSAQRAAGLGARFEIGEESVEALTARGISAEHFRLGYVPAWDQWGGGETERPVDVAYLGTADERRLGILAGNATDLAAVRTELLIPPHEPMTEARPDFVMGADKWRLLSRSRILLNLHREGKTAFEWVRGLEAMANGCLVITEPSTDLGPLQPGVHLLVAEASRIGAVIRSALAHPDLIASLARNAYDLCRTQLSMRSHAERLVAVAQELHNGYPLGAAVSLSQVRLPATGSPSEKPLAVWIPTAREFPGEGRPADPWLAEQLRELEELRAQHSTSQVHRMGDAGDSSPTVDVLCVQRPGDGPWRMTAASLGRPTPGVALHLSSAGRAPVGGGDGPLTILTTDRPIGRGAARNALLDCTSADYVAIVDAGDRFLGNSLEAMTSELANDAALDVVYCMATHGYGKLANALVPELRRLKRTPYLTRGFLVRRSFLEKVGGFVTDPYLDDLVDHCFWTEVARRQAPVRLLRRIGLELWPKWKQRSLAAEDSAGVMQRLRALDAAN